VPSGEPKSFGPLAPYYEQLMQSVPYDMWVDYYRLLLLTYDQDPNHVLDVACGTGKVARELSRVGYQVTGFDLSAAMIEAAKRKRNPGPHPLTFRVADATNFEFGEQYDGAYSFFDSLNYIPSLEGFRAALAQVRKHLKPGAAFIFDLNTAYAFEEKLFDMSDERKHLRLRYRWKGDYDPESRIIQVRMQFWPRDGAPFQEVHVQRAHRSEEVVEGLYDAGFEHIHCLASYTLDPPTRTSDRVHYVAW
jgi:SAM-dependent methyltransferase